MHSYSVALHSVLHTAAAALPSLAPRLVPARPAARRRSPTEELYRRTLACLVAALRVGRRHAPAGVAGRRRRGLGSALPHRDRSLPSLRLACEAVGGTRST